MPGDMARKGTGLFKNMKAKNTVMNSNTTQKEITNTKVLSTTENTFTKRGKHGRSGEVPFFPSRAHPAFLPQKNPELLICRQ
jgi:hypothetical protein